MSTLYLFAFSICHKSGTIWCDWQFTTGKNEPWKEFHGRLRGGYKVRYILKAMYGIFRSWIRMISYHFSALMAYII
jgi:hypothetical protein